LLSRTKKDNNSITALFHKLKSDLVNEVPQEKVMVISILTSFI